MSRSNPNANQGAVNPCKYFIEWKGGTFSYYDKQKGENVDLGHKLTFLVLDQLSTVKGWDDSSESGIYSNEVRDTRFDKLNVKSFKGGEIVSGIYSEIRDRIISAGGKFHASIYCVVKIDGNLELANISLRGAALSEWSEFKKDNRDDILNKAVSVVKKEARKKGATKYEVPVFAIKDVSEDTNEEATRIDAEILQPYLNDYLTPSSQPQEEEEVQSTDSIRNAPDPEVRQPVSAELDDELEDGLDPLPF